MVTWQVPPKSLETQTGPGLPEAATIVLPSAEQATVVKLYVVPLVSGT